MLKTFLNKLGFKKCFGCKKIKWGVKAQTISILGTKATIKHEEICRVCARKVEEASNPERNWGKQKKWN